MNIIVKKYIVSNLQSDFSQKFDDELEALDYIRTQAVGEKFMIMPSLEVVDEDLASYRATIVLTVFGHPQKTLRAIESVLNQDTNGWELLIFGDCCPNLQKLINHNYFQNIINTQELKGNRVKVINLPEKYGGFGYKQRNMAKKMAKGRYTLYLDNDDQLLPCHLSARLAVAENAEENFDIIGFETWLNPIFYHRDTSFDYGKIGHAEIIIKTEFLKTLPDSDGTYGHDWVLIENALNRGCSRTIIKGPPYSYQVMSLPGNEELGID